MEEFLRKCFLDVIRIQLQHNIQTIKSHNFQIKPVGAFDDYITLSFSAFSAFLLGMISKSLVNGKSLAINEVPLLLIFVAHFTFISFMPHYFQQMPGNTLRVLFNMQLTQATWSKIIFLHQSKHFEEIRIIQKF